MIADSCVNTWAKLAGQARTLAGELPSVITGPSPREDARRTDAGCFLLSRWASEQTFPSFLG